MRLLTKLAIYSLVLVTTLSLANAPVSAGSSFKDVPTNYWAKKEIDYLVLNKLMAGETDGTFGPDQNITREEAAILIGLALKVDTNNRANPNFTDVSTNDKAYPFISALVDKGVFTKAKQFNPKAHLTRAELAKILVDAFNLQGSTNKVFKDVPKNHWGYTHISKLVASNITAGKTSTTFDPKGNVTRAQMAVFVKRSLDYLSIAEGLPFANEMIKLINTERAKVKLPPLQLNVEATKVATIKAQDMRDNRYLAHESPTYGDWSDMLHEFGVPFKSSGENISAGAFSAESAMEDLMNSPGHRDNILGSHYTSVGIGTAEGGEWGFYTVQIFIHK